MRAIKTSEAIAEFEEMKRALSTPAGAAMLDRLSRFCHARKTCVVAGDRDLSYVYEGRRQVYLYLQDHIELTTEEYLQRYATPGPAQGAISHDDPEQSE